MLNYKQYIFDYTITWCQEEISEKTKFINGERIECNDYVIIQNSADFAKNMKIIVPDSNLKNTVYLVIHAIANFYKTQSYISSLDIHFFNHNELIIIDNKLDDFRKYQSFRIVSKDKYGDSYVDEVSIDMELSLSHSKLVINQICLKLLQLNYYLRLKSTYIGAFKAYNTPVIYSPQASGFFIHEVIGHLLEEDIYNIYGKNILDKVKINDRLTVIDDPTKYKNIVGLNLLDDTGKEIRPICLIKHGKIQNILSSDNGTSRRENYRKNTMPRMRSTFILPNSSMSLKELAKRYDECIIITHVYSGSCECYNGNYCMTGHGLLVVKENVVSVLSNIKVTANIKEHLENIEYIGNDFEMFSSDCSKIGHIVKVCMGGPSISFNGAIVEGGQYI